MPVKKVTVSLGLPFGLGKVDGEWQPDKAEREAAWEMYVELVTRVTVVELRPEDGLLREVLSSYHALFGVTREILKRGGPEIARPKHGSVSFGHLAVAILNQVLRPILARWHPALEDYESDRPEGTSRLQWERSWARNAELRADVAEVRTTLLAYAGLLGEVCDAKTILRTAVANPASRRDD
jgi:hypothetical protein